MPTGKHNVVAPPAKPHRRIRISDKDLKFVSENQQLAGFSGRITKATATYQPDMDAIAESARRFNAQTPSPQNRRPKLAHTLLLYGVLLHWQDGGNEIVQKDFPKRLRVLRNLLEASESEIRAQNMPALLRDVETLIQQGCIEQVHALNQAQKKNEIEKAAMLESAPHLAQALHQLEDHELLRGGLTAFDLQAEKFEARACTFLRLFTKSPGPRPWVELSGALLAHGSYFKEEDVRWTGYRFRELGSPNRDEPWQALFRGKGRRGEAAHPMRQPLMSLLDAVIQGSTLQNERNSYLNKPETQKDWRYYLVKYETMRSGESGRYAFNPSGYEACMTRTESGVRGYYYDPYLWALVVNSGIDSSALDNRRWPDSFSGYENDPRWLILKKSRLKLRSVDKGWEISDIPVDSSHQGAWEKVVKQGIEWNPETRTGLLPVSKSESGETDAKDRIELGTALLKELVALGM